jgi:acetyltransferase-like isoleucine patch superfamily enzyme
MLREDCGHREQQGSLKSPLFHSCSVNSLSVIAWSMCRLFTRIREKVFVTMVRGTFCHFGRRSSLGLPVILWRQEFISIASGVYFGPGSWLQVTADADVGGETAVITVMDDVSVTGGCFISAKSGVVIERGVLMGRNVHISDHSHCFDDPEVLIREQGTTAGRPVRICEGAWLGQGVVVCPGVTIGRNAVVGANSVVRSDIPARSVAVGAPARVVRTL